MSRSADDDFSMTPMGAIVAEMESSLEFEGYIRGSQPFERKLRERKVEKCRELRRFATCSECPAYDECRLLREHLRDL